MVYRYILAKSCSLATTPEVLFIRFPRVSPFPHPIGMLGSILEASESKYALWLYVLHLSLLLPTTKWEETSPQKTKKMENWDFDLVVSIARPPLSPSQQ